MTFSQQIITLALCAIATIITRFLPFLVFSEDRKTPPIIEYLGNMLPPALFGMLIIYCLRNTEILAGSHGIPELIALIVTVLLHLFKRQTLISIAGGTICYMLLLNLM